MSNYDDRLKDYVDVKERIRLFYERHPDGRLITEKVRVSREPDDVARVWVRAAAYRDPEDRLPGRGWSWLVLPGSTPYTRGSEIENAETSAWGRAIGALGIGIDKSIASADEVRTKAGDDARMAVAAESAQRPALPKPETDGLIGTVEVGQKGKADYELRETPDGFYLAFRLVGGNGGIKAEARDDLALQLLDHKDAVVGKRVTCWGRIEDQEFTPKGARKPVQFQVLKLERIRVPDLGDLPAPVEAPSESLGLVADDDMDAVMAAVPETAA